MTNNPINVVDPKEKIRLGHNYQPYFSIIYWPVKNPSNKRFIRDDSMNNPQFLWTLDEAIQRCKDLEDPMWGHAIVDAPESEEWLDMDSLRVIVAFP